MGRDFRASRVSDNGKVIGTNGVPDGQVTSSSLQAMAGTRCCPYWRKAESDQRRKSTNDEKSSWLCPGGVRSPRQKTEWLSRFRIEPPV